MLNHCAICARDEQLSLLHSQNFMSCFLLSDLYFRHNGIAHTLTSKAHVSHDHKNEAPSLNRTSSDRVQASTLTYQRTHQTLYCKYILYR